MRKIFCTLTIILLITISLFAQPKKRWGHFGLKTGLNFSTLRLNNEPANSDNEWKTGFVLGAFVKIPLTAKFALQPEFFYSSMGGNITHGFGEDDQLRLNYFSIPLLAKIKICKNWDVLAGPQVDFIISGKANDTKITDALNETGFGLAGGLEYQVVKGVSLSGRYFYGLTNALANDPTEKWFNHGAQLTINFQLQ